MGTDKNSAPLRLGMAGVGGWGRNVLRTFAAIPAVEVAAVCDPSPAGLKLARGICPSAAAQESFEALLGDRSIAAVALATPAPLHAEMARAALSAGKHVFVEKPLALSSADARELVALADRAERVLMVGHLLEYHPAVEMLKGMIDSGELGEVHYLYSQRVNLGVIRQDENALWSLAPHDVSVALHLLGAEPESVSARGSCYLRSGVEDVVFANLRFSGGRMAQIHVSWLDPYKERRLVVVGSRKMAAFDDMDATEKIRVYDKGAEVRRDSADAIQAISVRHGDIRIPLVPAVEPLRAELEHFADCIRAGRAPRSDGRDGLRVVRVLEAAGESLRRDGAPVRISGS